MRCYGIIAAIFVGLISHSLACGSSRAQDNAVNSVPIPPHRPKILDVSPAYIEQLMNQQEPGLYLPEPHISEPQETQYPADTPELPSEKDDTNPHSEGVYEDVQPAAGINSFIPPIPPAKPNEIPNISGIPLNDSLQNDLINATTQDILNIVDKDAIQKQKADEEESDTENNDPTLISFSMPPRDIILGEDVRSFLSNHVIPLFQNNDSFILEINAYATPIEGENYSEIRISMARALEIRKFLMNNRIPASRLKLKHMGSDQNLLADDRIDLILIK